MIRYALPLAAIGATAALFAGCGGSSSAPSPSSSAGSTSARTDRVLPVPKNPIFNTSTTPGLTITKVLVENNVDPGTGKAVDDHLEVAVKNTTAKPLTGLEIYYLIKDPKTKDQEGYHAAIPGVMIDPGATEVVNFDPTGQPGHIPVNKYSLYYTDKNELTVDVTASASGVGPATFTVKKDAGGAEAGVE